MIVGQLQSRLQRQYDLAFPYEVVQFVSHDEQLARQLSQQGQAPDARSEHSRPHPEPECLFIQQGGDTLEFTLYLDKTVMAAVSRHQETDQHTASADTTASLDNLCTVMEGVSHAVCLLWHAHHERQIRPVDLELQAEIDKFLLLLTSSERCLDRRQLHQQLFHQCRYVSEPGSELHARYRRANDFAADYCRWLVTQFIDNLDTSGLKTELARFYRLSGQAKFDRIQRLH